MEPRKITAVMAVMFEQCKLGIGTETGLPWKCPPDMKYFKSVTKDAVLVISMKTLLTIPNRLPDRQKIILTRDKTRYPEHRALELEGNVFASDVDQALSMISTIDPKTHVCVVGGAEIYELFKDHITHYTISYIPSNYRTATPTVFVNPQLPPHDPLAQTWVEDVRVLHYKRPSWTTSTKQEHHNEHDYSNRIILIPDHQA